MNHNIDILSIISDDNIIPYHAKWNTFTGSAKATLFLRQMIYWWSKIRRPFFKFARPCKHALYVKLKTEKDQLSWQEELGFSRREFESARSKVAVKVASNQIDNKALISYWVDEQTKLTWYALNIENLLSELAKIYPLIPPPTVGTQPFLTDLVEQMTTPKTITSKNGDDRCTKRTSIGDVQNVHLPISYINDDDDENMIKNDVKMTLDWMGFTGNLTADERFYATPKMALSWAWYVKINKHNTNIISPVGIARKNIRNNQFPSSQLATLAAAWLGMTDSDKHEMINTAAAGMLMKSITLPPSFPYKVDIHEFIKIYKATNGDVAPPHLMPEPGEQEGRLINLSIDDAGQCHHSPPHLMPEPGEQEGRLINLSIDDANEWQTCLEYLKNTVNRAFYNTWISPVIAKGDGKGNIVLVAANDYAKSQIEMITDKINSALGHHNWKITLQ